ncbi:MAG: hydantoinase/carbamoylase family amidase [Burkholderiales bacterium]|nr:hydantoinase/carbamoylase family amidase [Burkholderiales bacterium]
MGSLPSFDAGYAGIASALFDQVRALSRDGPGVTRASYGDVETRVLARLARTAAAEGIATSYDAAGNLWMTVPGRAPERPGVIAGSHADSVPRGGNYDGLAGIVAGLVCAIRMCRERAPPERTFTTVAFRGEESAWFGKPYLGSAALLGKLTDRDLALKHRDTGYPLRFYMREAGADPQRLVRGEPLVEPRSIAAYLELHIEQGPVLEDADRPIGIVTGIRGNFRHRAIRCIGTAGHSGAVPKRMRQDAVFAVADLLSRIEEAWDEWLLNGHDLVVTSGVLHTNADTHAPSIIPGEVWFSLEARSGSQETLDGFHRAIAAECESIGAARGVRFEFDQPIFSAPATMDGALVELLAGICAERKLAYMRVPSGAGHDAAHFANAGVPAAMVFVRNQRGSHNPDESMLIEDFMLGTDVLYAAVRAI